MLNPALYTERILADVALKRVGCYAFKIRRTCVIGRPDANKSDGAEVQPKKRGGNATPQDHLDRYEQGELF